MVRHYWPCAQQEGEGTSLPRWERGRKSQQTPPLSTRAKIISDAAFYDFCKLVSTLLLLGRAILTIETYEKLPILPEMK
jgi:hypothetical protein